MNMAIEEEIIHWWKDKEGNLKRTALRIESYPAELSSSGFPRDGFIFITILTQNNKLTIKLTPDEALRLSTQLLNVARELLNQKRKMWNSFEKISVKQHTSELMGNP